jgi:hypothetical protein
MIRPVFRWLTVRRLMVVILFLAVFAMATRAAVDPDMWWHLATGRTILADRAIPRHDPFSYTVPGRRWFTHEWLTQVVMYGLYLLGGKAALILATAAMVTISFVLVYSLCENRPYVAAFVTLVGVVSTAIVWGPRPQIVNILMMALFLMLIEWYRRGERRAVWALPPLTALWVNLHSGFFLGLGLLGAVLAGEEMARFTGRTSPRTLSPTGWRGLLLVLLLCVLAALLNPNGYHMLVYPFETLGSDAMQAYIQEWASPNFHRHEFWPFALLLLGGAAALILSRRPVDTTDLLLFLGFGFAGLLSARHIPLFAVAAVPVVTRALGDVRVSTSRRSGSILVNWLLLLLFTIMAGLWILDILQKDRQAERDQYPVAALEYIEERSLDEQRVYNSYNWGGYLIWESIPVYIDGRADVYMDAFMDEYVLAYQLRGDWRVPLDRYDVDYVLIESGASLGRVLEEAPEWSRVYEDEVAVIFLREPGDE